MKMAKSLRGHSDLAGGGGPGIDKILVIPAQNIGSFFRHKNM